MEVDRVEYQEEKGSFKPTELEWNHYIQYLIEAIDESKFMKRSEIKPMATPKASLESHITSRATHVRNAANIIRRLADGLGLNADFAYAGMLMHDAGHPFSAHEGEVTFTDIGKLFNTQFFHHNAKGVDVIISEDICEKAISKIPNIETQPELRKKLREEFYYFLDIVISHDGEASPSEMYRDPEEYPDIRTAVEQKALSANATNKYKFVAQTPEGRLAKYADVIAYLATDMQDGFRLGVYKDFPEDYLEIFGEMYATGYLRTREEKIAHARTLIEQIKEKRVRELFDDAKLPENQNALRIANRITAELSRKNIDFENNEEEANAVVQKHLDEYRKHVVLKNSDDEQFMYSEMEKIREFTGKKLKLRSGVVAEVTSKMQEYFINDLLRESASLGKLHFSRAGERLFFKAKHINYKTYTPYVKWEHQKKDQPLAALELVRMTAKSLAQTGGIRNKFFDPSVRKFITDPNALKQMKIRPKIGETVTEAQERYLRTRMKYGIRNFRTVPKYTTGQNASETQNRFLLFNHAYDHLQNAGESFARTYMTTYTAIETQIRDKMKKALDPEYPEKTEETSLYAEAMHRDVEKIRRVIKFKYRTLDITEEQREDFTRALVARERERMEEKMAIQYAVDYISGMSDDAFNELAIQTGVMDRSTLIDAERIPPEEAQENRVVNSLIQNMVLPAEDDPNRKTVEGKVSTHGDGAEGR